MRTFHIEKPDAFYSQLVSRTFPGYRGRKFRLEAHDNPAFSMNLNSYWSGGSRDYFQLINLSTMQTLPIPQNGTMFDDNDLREVPIPEGIAVVEHSIFCGKDCGITVHISAANAAKLLPASTCEASDNEKIVVNFSHLKNSYAGRNDNRWYEANRATGITRDQWEVARESCIAKGFLNKAGALTCAGRNLDCSGVPRY